MDSFEDLLTVLGLATAFSLVLVRATNGRALVRMRALAGPLIVLGVVGIMLHQSVGIFGSLSLCLVIGFYLYFFANLLEWLWGSAYGGSLDE